MSTTIRKVALGASAALVAMTAVTAAEAHGKHRFHRNFFFVQTQDCSFYKWKWLSTGRLFWKMRYFECRGW
jgi:hypothetical protein